MLIHEKGDFQLGAHAVGTGDQDGLLHANQIGGEQAAEAAQRAHDTGNVVDSTMGLMRSTASYPAVTST